MPRLPKLSAGYFAAPRMDLIDLFIGAEGTLGIVTEATLRVLTARPAQCLAFVPFADRAAALAFVTRLRERHAARGARGDPSGIDVSAIEHMDARCLALLREDGVDRANGVNLPETHGDRAARHAGIAGRHDDGTGIRRDRAARASLSRPTPLVRFCRLLDEFGVSTMWRSRCRAIARGRRSCSRVREAVPAGVNQRVGRAKRDIDARHREDGGGHDRALRTTSRRCWRSTTPSSRAAAWMPPCGATSPTATCTRTSSRGRWPTSISGKAAIAAVRARGDSPRRLPAGGARRRPEPREAALLEALYGARASSRCGGQARDRSGVEARAWRAVLEVVTAALNDPAITDMSNRASVEPSPTLYAISTATPTSARPTTISHGAMRSGRAGRHRVAR